jgi:hypothetical protein
MGVIGLLNSAWSGERAREKQRGRPLDNGPGDGGWLATGGEPAASGGR